MQKSIKFILIGMMLAFLMPMSGGMQVLYGLAIGMIVAGIAGMYHLNKEVFHEEL